MTDVTSEEDAVLQRAPAADIEDLRKWYELSQEDFARAVGVSRRAIIRWEQHEVSPSETARRSLELLWDIKQRLEPLYGQKAREWLHTPHRALRGNKPIAVLVTSGPVPVRDLVVGREAGGYRQVPAIRPRADVLRGAARAFEGTVYRARPQQWPYPLDSRGSLLYGARFNPPGLFAPLYASLDPWTACLELLDHTDEQADSILVYELRVRLAAVVDLRNQALLHALSHDPQAPITPAGLMASDLRLAVALAAVVSALGMEGLLVPSAAWDRHVMDPPGLVGTPAVPWGRPPGNAANLVILDSTRLPEPATLPAIYMGHVMLVWP